MIDRRVFGAAALAIWALCAVTGSSVAVGDTRHDRDAPIDVGADHIELQDKANRAILSGNVRVTQAEMTLNAARVTVAYTGQVTDGSPEVSRLDAAGGVTVSRPDQRARSNYAIYDINSRMITMIGAVNLVQGDNVVNGGRLTLNLDTGKAVIDGSSVSGSPAGAGTTTTSGRVTGRFSVPKRSQ